MLQPPGSAEGTSAHSAAGNKQGRGVCNSQWVQLRFPTMETPRTAGSEPCWVWA